MEKNQLLHEELNQLTALALARVALIEDILDIAELAAERLLNDVIEASKQR